MTILRDSQDNERLLATEDTLELFCKQAALDIEKLEKELADAKAKLGEAEKERDKWAMLYENDYAHFHNLPSHALIAAEALAEQKCGEPLDNWIDKQIKDAL